ncbi:Homocysteine S-methyltransferase [Daedaleopsis nitida]|nr:Homocysteine S-methyltransferase [Daedaleopsis nitida]
MSARENIVPQDIFHKDISTPLWSAKPIEDDPELIISAHLAFLQAGADVILTSTYQCAYATFERAYYSREDAKRLMLKSVKLAVEAKRRFLEEQDMEESYSQKPRRRVSIALSLGPYGATVSPAQEFDGFYPPPYGPDLSLSFGMEKTNTFPTDDEGLTQEHAAIDALTAFHYERLCVFADDPETWAALDFVAFETVPLRREIHAIRSAVTQLQSTRGLRPYTDALDDAKRMKPWWISTVHPDGKYPEMKSDGVRATAAEVAEAALQGGDEAFSIPWGFGINCTGLEFLAKLVGQAECQAGVNGRRPWLLKGDRRGTGWAKELRAVLAALRGSQVWDGIVVGGCCKTGPEEIASLRRELGV